MNSGAVKDLLQRRGTDAFDLYERRPGDFQLIAPIMHEVCIKTALKVMATCGSVISD